MVKGILDSGVQEASNAGFIFDPCTYLMPKDRLRPTASGLESSLVCLWGLEMILCDENERTECIMFKV